MGLLYASMALLLVGSCLALNAYKTQWEEFKSQYKRKYTSAREEEQRLHRFIENTEKVIAHNELYNKGLVSYSMTINDMSDRFPEEIEKFKGYKSSTSNHESSFVRKLQINNGTVTDDSIDWRDKGAVTPVKDQRRSSCHSSYAFSATGALEALQFIEYKKLVTLSEQNIMDCSWNYDNLGCNGGTMLASFYYVMENNGIDTEKSYPYLAKEDYQCHYKKENRGGSCKFIYVLSEPDEDAMKVVVNKFAPVTAAIVATDNFLHYNGGIFYDDSCKNRDLNHAVLVVGYGTQNGSDYWIVKNSWGESWGLQGYILMSRNRGNNCGIASASSFPAYH